MTTALDAAGIPRRRPGWTDGAPPAPITAEQRTELYTKNSKTVGEVAAALGTTTRVNAALRRHASTIGGETQQRGSPTRA